jgi:septum formation protein
MKLSQKIILASKSPRRKEILSQHYDITVDVSGIDEEAVKRDKIEDLVEELARLKAKRVASRHSGSVIVAADTLVYFNKEEIGQAKDDADAERMLKKLLGKTHEVYSGICVIFDNLMLLDHEISKVTLKNVPDNVLKEYISSGLYKGKAGAYNINDPEFKIFVDKVEGCYFNIMGMPIKKVKKMIGVFEK